MEVDESMIDRITNLLIKTYEEGPTKYFIFRLSDFKNKYPISSFDNLQLAKNRISYLKGFNRFKMYKIVEGKMSMFGNYIPLRSLK